MNYYFFWGYLISTLNLVVGFIVLNIFFRVGNGCRFVGFMSFLWMLFVKYIKIWELVEDF